MHTHICHYGEYGSIYVMRVHQDGSNILNFDATA